MYRHKSIDKNKDFENRKSGIQFLYKTFTGELSDFVAP